MKIQTAKKDHACALCGRKIPAGHRYWRRNSANPGESVKEHTNCELYVKEEPRETWRA